MTETKNFEFFQHKQCEYFPCHQTNDIEHFNCMYCFCPLYFIEDCGGNCSYTDNGIKDCTNCVVPHYNREKILERVSVEIEKRAEKRTEK